MKAVILDMYGVILKDSGDGFYSYVNRTFPQLTPADIYPDWDKADVGEISSLEVFRRLGFQGDLEMKKPDPRIFQLTLERLGCTPEECVYIDDRRYNLEAAQALGMDTVLFNSRNVPYDGKAVKGFGELADTLAGR
ncbi:HAD-IA family hydrolase [Eisenbergiella sp.]